MNLADYKSKYAGLSSADVTRLVASDSEFRAATEALYVAYFRSPLNKSCGDCWKDAYVLLMRRTRNIEMEMERLFELKAGALLRDVRNLNDSSKLCTRLNMTDELALYHLGTNPNYIGLFAKYPDNWQKLANDYVAKLDGKKAKAEAAAPEVKEAVTEDAKDAETKAATEKKASRKKAASK